MFSACKEGDQGGSPNQYDLSDRTRGMNCGGLGLLHHLAWRTGLIEAIDRRLHLLKIHLPYHEADHVLNMAYNIVSGGTCLASQPSYEVQSDRQANGDPGHTLILPIRLRIVR